MHVEIGEVSSTVRAVDGDALLSPRLLERIVSHVARILRAEDERERRGGAERKITDGVSAERDAEE